MKKNGLNQFGLRICNTPSLARRKPRLCGLSDCGSIIKPAVNKSKRYRKYESCIDNFQYAPEGMSLERVDGHLDSSGAAR